MGGVYYVGLIFLKMRIEDFDLTGKRNEYLDLVFTIEKRGRYFILAFLVEELSTRGTESLKITMAPEKNHRRPHIHIDRGRHHHIASIALDGTFLVDSHNISGKERLQILKWISQHKKTLYELWNCINEGRDYSVPLRNIKETWEYEDAVYKGRKPDKEIELEGVKIWHNGNLQINKLDNGKTKIICNNDVCVYFSAELIMKKKLFVWECPKIQSNI